MLGQGTDCRGTPTVRVALQLLALAMVSINAFATQEGSFCAIPRLTPGVPVEVHLEYIEKPFCGMALIDGRYQKLSDITGKRDEGEVACKTPALCSKVVRYYPRNADRQEPYVIIFTGPKTPIGS